MPRPKNDIKKVAMLRRVREDYVPIIDSFIKMLEENDGMVTFQAPEIETVEPPVDRSSISPKEFAKMNGVILMDDDPDAEPLTPKELKAAHEDFLAAAKQRETKPSFGISVDDFLKKVGKEPISVQKEQEEEKDYTAWQKNDYMCQVDKGIMYEPDPYGYPDEALEVQRKYKDLWVKCFSAKQNKNTALYNEYMTELYERIQNG